MAFGLFGLLLEEKVRERKGKLEECTREFKFNHLDFRIEHLHRLEKHKCGAYVMLIPLFHISSENLLFWRMSKVSLS